MLYSRSLGASIARPVEHRPPVSRDGSTISVTSSMSTNSSTTAGTNQPPSHGGAASGVSTAGRESSSGHGDNSRAHGREGEVYDDSAFAGDVFIEKRRRRGESSVSVSRQERLSGRRQVSVEPQPEQSGGPGSGRNPVAGREGESPRRLKRGEETDGADSDSQEETLVNLPASLPDVNHNSIKIAGQWGW